MADIPSFFNKGDFYGVLLPGYLVIITYLALFHPSLLLGTTALPFDLLSALVFLVAGPVTGLTVRAIVDLVIRLLYIRGSKERRKELDRFARWYVHGRLCATDAERLELDNMEAELKFNTSSGLGLAALGLARIYFRGVDFLSIVPLGASVLLLIAYFSLRYDWGYLIVELMKKYPLK